MAHVSESSDNELENSEDYVVSDSDEDEHTKSELLNPIISDSDEGLSNSTNSANISNSYPEKRNTMLCGDDDDHNGNSKYNKSKSSSSKSSANIKVKENKRINRIFDTDSDDDDHIKVPEWVTIRSNTQNRSKKNNTSNRKHTVENSFTEIRSMSSRYLISSDSDDEKLGLNKVNIRKDIFATPIQDKSKTKKKNVIVDSDDEGDNDKSVLKSTPKINIKSSDSEEGNIHSSPIEEVANISAQFDKIRMSQDFKGKGLLSSTIVDATALSSTPVNLETGKRLLNKSIETPRLFKQAKESNTPSLEKQEAYTPREVIPLIASSSEDENDIIDVSDDDRPRPQNTMSKKQPTLIELLKKKPPVVTSSAQSTPEFIEVSSKQYYEQLGKIRRLQSDLQKTLSLTNTINLEHLPDKGQSLKNRQQSLQRQQKEEEMKLSRMKITHETNNPPSNLQTRPKLVSWHEIEAAAVSVQPNTFGKKAISTYNAQKALTIDRLQQLHGSLETCPKETDLAEPPRGLKVELMHHQRRALSWLMWRENQKPAGGILADDMGLGKTLTMISLMLKCNEVERNSSHDDDEEDDGSNKKTNGGTLVVCPASLINQWSGELERRTKRGLASFEVYHGPKRETKPKRLAQHDLVITTYSIVNNECEKNGTVFRVNWRRIIIDEAHQIRNHKSQTSDAVCRLPGKARWALTGTPVHNKELDMYALLKFLRCSPFDDIAVWKRWVGDKSTGGAERLHTVISSLMLRRTKPELIEKGLLNTMPKRKWELIPVELSKSERDVYSKILIFSRTLFAQFLHQRAEKNQDARDCNVDIQQNGPNQEYFLMRQKLLRLNKLGDIKQHEILVLLLRLRQICNHPSLITGMLHEDMDLIGDEQNAPDKAEALDLLDQLNRLAIEEREEPTTSTSGIPHTHGQEEALTLKEVVKTVLSPSDPIFTKTRLSSKIKAVIRILNERVLTTSDKAIVVSQWPSFLELIAYHLKNEDIKYDQLDGKVPVAKRMEMVDRFNNPKDKMRILLLSLTAGGVGLNLVGANHLILLDLHWNPQLENQAQDRIYRVGQEKPVFVYKFMATDTIETRILELQQKKLDIANSMLTGTVQASRNKLTLQDLKLLFEM